MNAIVESSFFLILSIALLLSVIVLCWILVVQLVRTNRMVSIMKKNPDLSAKFLTNRQFKILAISTLLTFIVRFSCMLLFHAYLRALPSGVYSGNAYGFVFEMVIYKYPYIILFFGCMYALYQIGANIMILSRTQGEGLPTINAQT